MEYLFVVYILMNDVWVRGDDMTTPGWSSYPYATEQACVEAIGRAEAIQLDLKVKNPNAYDKRFECEPNEKTDEAEGGSN